MRNLKDRVVVVTGAGSGIGRASAEAFAAEGARVHVADVVPERVEQVVTALRSAGHTATGHEVDVGDEAEVKGLAARVLEAEGRVDVVHNNAGVGLGKPFLQTSQEDWDWIVRVNFWGVVYGCRAFLPAMLEQGQGTLVNTASVFGLLGAPNVTAYTATKFAVVGFSESLHLEVMDRGVTVAAVCPGLIATRIIDDGRVSRADDPDGRKAATSFARHGARPEAVARDVVRGVKKGRTLIVTPRHARALAATRRLLPGVQQWFAARLDRFQGR